MHTNPESMAYEIKIILRADGSRVIESKDSNGNGMNLLAVREAVTWANQKIQDEVVLTMMNAALVQGMKEKTGVIIPKLV